VLPTAIKRPNKILKRSFFNFSNADFDYCES
jgi:hypothetical protein